MNRKNIILKNSLPIKHFVLLFLFSFSYTFIHAKSGKEFLEAGKVAQKKLLEKEALEYYKQAIKENPREIEALNQASILCSNIGHRATNMASKKSYYKAAAIYAKTALKINPKNANANFAMAVAYGRKVYLINSPKPRIAMSALIKQYAERSIQINPNHSEALTLLGMWHYERATLTFAEKKIVAFLGGLPSGSLAQAKKYLERSKSLSPNNIATLMELGKLYKEIGTRNEVIKIWNQALTKSNQYKDDVSRKKEIKRRLAKI